MERTDSKSYREGVISVLACNTLWGILPIYWNMLKPISSTVVIFYRIFMVAVVCTIWALIKYKPEQILEPFRDKKTLLRFILAGMFITINWSIYIWAVNSGNVIQTCIGYFIEPLVVCLFGMVLFKEKLSRYKKIALFLGALGVVIIIAYFRQIPIIALSVAVSFACYTALKKGLGAPPILSLIYETIALAPIAMIVIIYLETTGNGALAVGNAGKYALLMLSGLFTAIPLALFGNAANKTSMFVLGLAEYISPSIALMVSIFYFKEDFYKVQLVAFAVIWIGLVFFTKGEFEEYRAQKTGHEGDMTVTDNAIE